MRGDLEYPRHQPGTTACHSSSPSSNLRALPAMRKWLTGPLNR